MINMKTHLSQSGFTIVEALVAIAILLLSITSAFSIAQSSLQSSNLVKNRTTAYFLAQEGVEYIRHLRDNNGLSMLDDQTKNIHWLQGFAAEVNDPCAFGKACIVYITGQTPPKECNKNGVCPNLKIYSPTNVFNYTQGDESKFNRRINISEALGHHEIKVTVTVTWAQGSIQRSLEVSENLFNWQQLQPL